MMLFKSKLYIILPQLGPCDSWNRRVARRRAAEKPNKEALRYTELNLPHAVRIFCEHHGYELLVAERKTYDRE